MARGVNKVIIVGNCGSDPEVKYMPSGRAVTNISVATSESWKDKNTGQQQYGQNQSTGPQQQGGVKPSPYQAVPNANDFRVGHNQQQPEPYDDDIPF